MAAWRGRPWWRRGSCRPGPLTRRPVWPADTAFLSPARRPGRAPDVHRGGRFANLQRFRPAGAARGCQHCKELAETRSYLLLGVRVIKFLTVRSLKAGAVPKRTGPERGCVRGTSRSTAERKAALVLRTVTIIRRSAGDTER